MVTWGEALRPQPGQSVSGDGSVVEILEGGALLAVIDGLGHGAEAAKATAAAAAVLRADPSGSLLGLFQRCDAALHATRGVVMTLARITDSPPEVTWAAVGNVETRLLRADPAAVPQQEGPVSRGGVVGYSLPPVKLSTQHLFPGDTLVFATDGVRLRGLEPRALTGELKAAAADLLARHFVGNDDGLVLLARWVP